MSQVLQTNGDYTIKSAVGGIIKLDVGPPTANGQVIITSDLIVEGETLTVEAENLNIRDNVIRLNFGETGAGVTLRYAGVQIDRGSETAASLFWDENDDTFNLAIGTATTGSFNYANTALRVNKITSSSGQDLHLLGFDDPSQPPGTPFNANAVVTVTGTNNYEDQVTDDDDIPNKKYVDDSIRDNPTFQIIEQDTRVIVTDKDQLDPLAGSISYLTANTPFSTLGESAVSIIVDNKLAGQFYNNRLEVGDLELGGGVDGNEISSRASITNENIVIRTQGTGKLQTNYAIQLEKIGTSGETPPLASPYTPVTPAYVPGSTLLYAGSANQGSTGLYFVNDSSEISKQEGELISKNKALLFSMIF